MRVEIRRNPKADVETPVPALPDLEQLLLVLLLVPSWSPSWFPSWSPSWFSSWFSARFPSWFSCWFSSCSTKALLCRPGGISVHYSLNFEVNSLKISWESVDVATELLEPSVVSRLKQMVTKALQEEASLPIDLDTLRFDLGRRRIR